MAGLSQDDLNKLKAELKAQADFQQKINESTTDYIKLINDIKILNKSITQAKQKQAEQEAKSVKAASDYQTEVNKGLKANKTLLKDLERSKLIEEAKLKILADEVVEIQRMTTALGKQAREANKLAVVFTGIKKTLLI